MMNKIKGGTNNKKIPKTIISIADQAISQILTIQDATIEIQE